MHIVTTAGELQKALKTVEPAVSRRAGNIPVLGCVLFDGASVTACDLDMQIRSKFAAARAKGSTAVVFRQLKGICAGLPADTDMRLTKEGGAPLVLSFEGGSYELLSMPADDFPALSMPAGDEVSVPEGFTDALRSVQPFISTEETRYYLNGICLSTDKDGVPAAVATDGRRLGAHRIGFKVAGNPILFHQTVTALVRLPNPTHCTFTSAPDDKVPTWVRFRFTGVELVAKLIKGQFPDWTRVVPAYDAAHPALKLDTQETQKVLRRLSCAGHERAMMFAATGDTVVACRKADADGMSGSERLRSAEVANWRAGSVFCFNTQYIGEMLRAHRKSATVELSGADYAAPCLIRGESGDFVTVLMPMRSIDEAFASRSLSLVAAEKLAAVA